jgi:hypothetical protein
MGRYSNTLIKKNTKGNNYYISNRYVEIPRTNSDIYVITAEKDRYDILANQYYNDPSFWWVISSANPEYIGSLFPPVGVQLRIPSNLAFVLNALNVNE